MATPPTVSDDLSSQSTTVADGPGMIALAQDMHHATSVYVGTIFVAFGLVGNALSIIVWRREKMTSSTGTYLIGQSVADIGVLLLFFFTDSIVMMEPDIGTSYSYGVFFAYIGYPIFFLCVVCSIWFTVGVTVDRYLLVCWMKHAQVWCSIRRARLTLGLIALLSFIVNAPHFWTFKAVPESDREPTDPGFRFTDYGASGGSKDYEFWVHCMFLVLVPWTTILTLNILIIQNVHATNVRMNCIRSALGRDKTRKSEAQMTRLLLTVTFTFLVLLALQCITQCFFMQEKGSLRLVSEAYAVAKLGVVINSSINFLLYCISARRFRNELKIVLCRRFAEARKGSMSFQLSTSSSGTDGSKSRSSNTST